jgi:hypothetical protein
MIMLVRIDSRLPFFLNVFKLYCLKLLEIFVDQKEGSIWSNI